MAEPSRGYVVKPLKCYPMKDLKGGAVIRHHYSEKLERKMPRDHNNLVEDFEKFYEHKSQYIENPKVNVGVVFGCDKETALKVVEQLRGLVETAGVGNYILAMDTSKLFITRAPRFLSGGVE